MNVSPYRKVWNAPCLLVVCFSLAIAISACGSAAAAPAQNIFNPPTGVDSAAWAAIPAGEFLYGPHNQTVAIDQPYEIMLTDVTNAQYARFLNEAAPAGEIKIQPMEGLGMAAVGSYPGDAFHGVKHEIEIPAGEYLLAPLEADGIRITQVDGSYQAVEGYENRPVVMVTWFGARAYCRFYGWRLPGEVEWEKAARGEDGRAYPWGDEINPQYANYYSSQTVFQKLFGSANETTPVGLYNGSTYANGLTTANAASPYGVYDMAGNVWQWVGDVFEGTHYRYMTGGSKVDYGYNLRLWTRNSAAPDYYSPNVGFRCAR